MKRILLTTLVVFVPFLASADDLMTTEKIEKFVLSNYLNRIEDVTSEYYITLGGDSFYRSICPDWI